MASTSSPKFLAGFLVLHPHYFLSSFFIVLFYTIQTYLSSNYPEKLGQHAVVKHYFERCLYSWLLTKKKKKALIKKFACFGFKSRR